MKYFSPHLHKQHILLEANVPQQHFFKFINNLKMKLDVFSTSFLPLSPFCSLALNWFPVFLSRCWDASKKEIWIRVRSNIPGIPVSPLFEPLHLLIFPQLQVARWTERRFIYLCQSVTSAERRWRAAEKVSALTDVFVCGAADHAVVSMKSLSIVITTVIWLHVVQRRSS